MGVAESGNITIMTSSRNSAEDHLATSNSRSPAAPPRDSDYIPTIPRPVSGKAYHVGSRPLASSHEYPAPPQSTGMQEAALTPRLFPPHLTQDLRRPLQPHSLPPPSPASLSAIHGRYVQSEQASLSPHDWKYDDTTAGPSSYPGSSKQNTTRSEPRRLSLQPRPPPQTISPTHIFSSYSLSDAGRDVDDEDPTARHTWRSLVHVALGAVPLSFGTFIYTLVALIFSIFTSPLRLCVRSRPSFSSQVWTLLIPPLNLQRRCIYIAPVGTPSSRISSSSSRTPLSTQDALETQNSTIDISAIRSGSLVTIHLLTPLLSVPLALAAWIMALGWGLSVVVSDERAGDDRDERRLAQNLVDYWAVWLNWRMDDMDENSSEWRGRSRERPEMTTAGAK